MSISECSWGVWPIFLWIFCTTWTSSIIIPKEWFSITSIFLSEEFYECSSYGKILYDWIFATVHFHEFLIVTQFSIEPFFRSGIFCFSCLDEFSDSSFRGWHELHKSSCSFSGNGISIKFRLLCTYATHEVWINSEAWRNIFDIINYPWKLLDILQGKFHVFICRFRDFSHEVSQIFSGLYEWFCCFWETFRLLIDIFYRLRVVDTVFDGIHYGFHGTRDSLLYIISERFCGIYDFVPLYGDFLHQCLGLLSRFNGIYDIENVCHLCTDIFFDNTSILLESSECFECCLEIFLYRSFFWSLIACLDICWWYFHIFWGLLILLILSHFFENCKIWVLFFLIYFLRIFTNVSLGILTFPNIFIFFFPSFCFSRSFRFRVISHP